MASSRRAIVAAVAADATIAALKFVGGALTGSAVMVAEGIHSLVDGGNASLLLLGSRRARRPPNSRHPFGYGGELYFWTVVVAMLAFVVGGGFAVLEGLLASHRRHPGRLWPNLVVLGGALAFEAASLTIGVRELRRYQRQTGYRGGLLAVMRQSHDPPIFIAVVEDTVAIAGLVVALAGLLLARALGSPAVDAAASIVDGVVLMATAVWLGREAYSLVVGEGAGAPLVDDARALVRAHPAVDQLTMLRTLQLGPDTVLVTVRARFTPGLDAAALAAVAHELEGRLRGAHPSIKHVLFAF